MKNQTCLFLFVILILAFVGGYAQKPVRYDLEKLAKNKKLKAPNREISILTEPSRNGVKFSEGDNETFVWLDEVKFSNGVIELDIRGRDVLQKSFLGVAFHAVDSLSDIIYFRPFNFQSGDPVRKIHAVQYVSFPEFGWKRLRDEQNGKYEKAVDPAPGPEDWFHAKIVVKYPTVTVFVNGNSQPSLTIDKLNTRTSGKFGLWIGPVSDGSFSNLVVTSMK